MDAEEALGIVETALRDERLSKLQATVFRHAWDELSYQEIAHSAGYEVGYIKQAGSQLWQSLSKVLGEKVSKNNVQSVIKRYVSQSSTARSSTENWQDRKIAKVSDGERDPWRATMLRQEVQPNFQRVDGCHPTGPHQDWGEATDTSIFYGRTEELAILERWILHDRCRLIGLFGMGGIGKTSLSVQLAKQIQAEFEYVIWRSLRNAPPIQDLLADLIQFFSNQQATHLPISLDQQILRLLDSLRAHRCLLIFDNAETLMQAGDREGNYQSGYEGYGQLLRCVGEAYHQSCLVLTSREKPKGVAPREGHRLPVRSLQLAGLPPTVGRELFQVKGEFAGSAEDWQRLINHYAGNPLALKIVATAIADFFSGSIAQFLAFSQTGGSVFGDIRDLLNRQIGRLSELEQQVMYWLAINREPISLAELQADCFPPVSPTYLLETLTALERRSLIERSHGQFTLQPAVMEYLIDQLIEQACAELAPETPLTQGEKQLDRCVGSLLPGGILRSHALIKAQAKDYIRETQIRLILQPIADRLLRATCPTQLDTHLMNLLSQLRGQSAQATGYMGGNIINLLCQLQATSPQNGKYSLCDRDFSRLTIWQAYLRKAILHRTNFADSDLSNSVFSETFSQILSIAFSPNGQLLAASDISYEAHVWRVADGKKLLTCKATDGWAWAVAFSPDSRLLASSANGTIHFWDVQTGTCVQTLRSYTSRIFSLAFSPDGAYLASGSEDHQVRIWQVATGELVTVLSGHTDEVHSVAFSPDGCLLASGSYDRTIKLWNVALLPHTPHPTPHTLASHADWVWSVAFSPHGQILASSSSDRTIKFWDVETRQCIRTLIGHVQPIRSIAFVPPLSGSAAEDFGLISGSEDQTVRLWNREGECWRVLQGHTSWVSAVASSSDGCLVASGSEDQSVRLWNIRTNHCLKVLQGYNSGVWSVAFSPDGQHLISAGQDRAVKIWNLPATYPHPCSPSNSVIPSPAPLPTDAYLRHSLEGHRRWIWSVAVSSDGQTIASGSEDGTVRLWHRSSGQSVMTLHGHTHAVWSVAFSLDGCTLVSASLDGTIRLWQRSSGQCQQVLRHHRSGVWSVAFAPATSSLPQGQQFASGSQDQTIQLWELRDEHAELTVHPLRTFTGHTSWIRCVAFSPDGQILASGSSDGILKLWHLETGTCLHTLQAHTSLVLAIAFNPKEPILATSGGDGNIYLWDISPLSQSFNAPVPVVLRSLSCLAVLQGHQKWIRSLSYHPDGQLLASCSQDGTVKLWEGPSTQCLATLRMPRPYEGLNIRSVAGLTTAQKETLTALGALEMPLEAKIGQEILN